MKKFILLCLVAGTTLLASTQISASICSNERDLGRWKACMEWCVAMSEKGPLTIPTCLLL
ncbi:hypothetical protein PSI23_21200 [Xenorhabdus sp. XENO-10]|uniref:Uncharacterized protein n=1 Tax=Xenorhabdus yunnanensis TaxID=3025878 RepID=A0ABT5LKT1_9GAMM|nr:hypothetical protein [Xenorhabdus yunnanensis]MDC9591727.1 hypothetical protein [Xenorhabdus yunnanensis]